MILKILFLIVLMRRAENATNSYYRQQIKDELLKHYLWDPNIVNYEDLVKSFSINKAVLKIFEYENNRPHVLKNILTKITNLDINAESRKVFLPYIQYFMVWYWK
jgi:hypothetical protein